MIKRKLNIKRVVIAILLLIILIVLFIYLIFKRINNINSIEYKLEKEGYIASEIEKLKDVLTDDELNDFYSKKYDKEALNFIDIKHFNYNNLDKYLKYDNKKTNYSYEEIVTLINVHADEEDYENINLTDTKLGNLMLVNKNNMLDSGYVPNEIITIDESYAYYNVKISKDIYDAFLQLIDGAKNKGYTLVASFGYRNYSEQESIYNEYKSLYGRYEADKIVAHPGCSDHQTGLALEIEPYDKDPEDVESNEEYIWLIENSYKYGFIQRYPKGKEYITKFDYEPWHFRYVGIEAAYKIHNENLTLEEYYYYYVK